MRWTIFCANRLGSERWIDQVVLVLLSAMLTVAGTRPALAAAVGSDSIDKSQTQVSQSPAAGQPGLVTPLMAADLMSVHQQYASAIAAYQQIEPKTAYIYNKIGVAYEREQRDGDAEFYFRQAIRTDRKYAPAYNNLGTVYYREGDRKGAQRMYKTAIRLDGKDASYWSNLGTLYLSKKDYRDGIECYQRAYSLNSEIFDEIAMNGIRNLESPEDVAAVDLCFAEVYAQAGMKAAAIEYLRKSLVAGLRDPQRLKNDTQLASLHGMPEFEQLFQKPVAQ